MELATRVINEAPTDISADEAVDWYADMLRNSRRFAWARTIAREHSHFSGQPHDVWEYLGNVSQLLVRRNDYTDAEIQDILPMDAAPDGLPVEEQIRIARGIHAALHVPGLLDLAASAPIGEIVTACSDVVLLFIGLIALVDTAWSRADVPAGAKPPVLSDIWGDDPALLAVFGLILVSIKRQTGLSGVQSWIDEMREPTLESVKFLLDQLSDAAPRLAVLAERYLTRRDTGDLFAPQPAESR